MCLPGPAEVSCYETRPPTAGLLVNGPALPGSPTEKDKDVLVNKMLLFFRRTKHQSSVVKEHIIFLRSSSVVSVRPLPWHLRSTLIILMQKGKCHNGIKNASMSHRAGHFNLDGIFFLGLSFSIRSLCFPYILTKLTRDDTWSSNYTLTLININFTNINHDYTLLLLLFQQVLWRK